MILQNPDTRRAVIITLTIFIAVCIIFAGITVYSWAKGQLQLRKIGQPSFNTLPMEDLKDGLIVTGTIDLTMGNYAWESITSDTDMDTNLYYLIPIYDIDGEGYYVFHYFIGYKAATEDVSTMEKISEQTWNETTAPVVLTVENGIIHNLNGDLKQYLAEWVEEPGFYDGGSFIDWCAEYNILGTADREIIQSKIVPYWIEETQTVGTDLLTAWVFLIMAAIFLLSLLTLKLIFRKRSARGNAS